jgi:hypothetical protein
MIEPFWWIRSAGVAAAPVSNSEPQVSRRDRPTRAAFFVSSKKNTGLLKKLDRNHQREN